MKLKLECNERILVVAVSVLAGACQSRPITAPHDGPALRDTISERPPGKKRVFVTSTAYQGDFAAGTAAAGTDKADDLCKESAAGAGLGGTWRAWISRENGVDAISRIVDVGPWYRLDGVEVADAKAKLTKPGPPPYCYVGPPTDYLVPEDCPFLLAPINVTETGQPISTLVWTGTGPDGHAGGTCLGWKNKTAWSARGTAGSSDEKSSRWTATPDSEERNCPFAHHLYCFEQ